MSSYIPLHIQLKIMKKLPLKSVIRSRSVCKSWKSSIDSSEFIVDYSIRDTQPCNLLLWSKHKYISIVDDDTFPKQNCTPIMPPLVVSSIILGSSQGLFCSYTTNLVVVWNPSTRYTVTINLKVNINAAVFGFVVLPDTLDPKIVKITSSNIMMENETVVEFFTLSSREWRSNLPPRKSIAFKPSQIAIGQSVYWIAADRIAFHHHQAVGMFNNVFKYLIMSLDMGTEKFTEIDLPVQMADGDRSDIDFSISKLNDSLVVCDCHPDINEQYCCHVWIMENGDSLSFKKLYTIQAPYGFILYPILGFRKSGEPIVIMEECSEEDLDAWEPMVYVYEPCSMKFQCLEDLGGGLSPFVDSMYMESLLLLDQEDKSAYSL